jgi:cell division protein FtsQ
VDDRSRQDRTRRRFARRQWVRRWLTWRYLLAGVLVAGAIGFAVYAVYFSPWLRLESAEVVGTSQLTEAEVLAAAEVPTGGALARVDIEAIEARVRSLETVKSVVVSRQWPHEVRIAITERTPVAVIDNGGSFTQLDAEGWTFGAPLSKAPPGLPRVEFGPGADDAAQREAAAAVAALDDDVTERVDHVRVDTVDQILLVLRSGSEVRWGSAEQSDEKAQVLLDLLEARPKAEAYDVSVPGLPTTRP